MMSSKLIGLLVAGAAALAVPTGCASSGRGYVVASYDEEAPPPPRREYVAYHPGYVWIHGTWVRGYDNQWRWRNGYYVRERAGYAYQQGRWERRGRGYVWVDGGWRPQGGVVVRNHRRW